MASKRLPEARLSELSARFRRFAEVEAAGYSPLYELLAFGIAGDADLLALAAGAPAGQPTPNLFLGAVHYLVLSGVAHSLAGFYASVTNSVRPPSLERRTATEAGGALAAFRDFCAAYRADIDHLLRTRLVQTNEVGRSACLMPAFNHVASFSNAPLALIDVGASAGLNLLCDRYFYDYGDLGTAGDPSSPLRLTCQVVGGNRPPVEALPAIAYRAGCDLNVSDVSDADQALWLRALVWPEHRQRAEALAAAMTIVRADPPRLVEGNGADLLPSLIEEVPGDLTICVIHSFVFNQIPRPERERFYATLARYAWKRPIFDISFEHTSEGVRTAAIEMARCVRGEWRRIVLAKCHAHGQSIEWLV